MEVSRVGLRLRRQLKTKTIDASDRRSSGFAAGERVHQLGPLFRVRAYLHLDYCRRITRGRNVGYLPQEPIATWCFPFAVASAGVPAGDHRNSRSLS